MSGSAEPTPPEGVASREAPAPAGMFLLVAALYAVSGAAGLVYEVAWGRRLALVLGATSVSGAVVLAAFLGALGLGARLVGRAADRSRAPLALYGALELAAALWALALPLVMPVLESGYVHAAASLGGVARIGIAFLTAVLAVGPGAACLGATFPCVLRAVAREGRSIGRAANVLYGLNTAGAVAGALWAGFAGIAALGVNGTTRVAAGLAAVVGVLAIVLGRRASGAPAAPADDSAAGPAAPRLALVAAASCGLIALGLEAAGLRILVFFIEGFTASFAAMLGVFLAGLAIGALVVGPLLQRVVRASTGFGLLMLAGGAAVLVLGASIPRLEAVLRDVRDGASRSGDPLEALRHTALVGSALLFLAPSILLGAAFPLCVRWAGGSDARGLGRRVGAVALSNAIGSVAGPLLVLGVGLLGGAGTRPGGPLLAWSGLGLLSVAIGAVVSIRSLGLSAGRVRVVGVAAGLALGFGVPTLLTQATPEALVRASRVVRDSTGEVDARRRLVEVRADETTTASVLELPTTERILYTDEFAAAATGSAYPYMRMLGHLPALLARRPANAMVIAFGTGTTAGALALADDVARLEIVEASRAVYGLAPRFEAVNRSVLDDPRVVRRVDDGRHALLLHPADLDVLTLEPLMPYTPAALPFYTREFYELARDRLAEGGVVCQWVPIHAMEPEVYAALLRTFFDVFPDGSLWLFEQSTILLGRKGASAPPIDEIRARAERIQRHLVLAGWRLPSAIGAAYVASGRRVLEVIDDPSRSSEEAVRAHPLGPLARRVVTDDDPFPEFHPAPRSSIPTSYAADTLAWLAGLAGGEDGSKNPFALYDGTDSTAKLRAGLSLSLVGRAAEAAAEFRLATARDASERAAARKGLETAVESYEEVQRTLQGADASIDIRRIRLSRRLLMMSTRDQLARADAARKAGDATAAKAALEEAITLARRAYEFEPLEPVLTARVEATALRAEVLAMAGRCAEASEWLAEARAAYPRDPGLADIAGWLSARANGVDPLATGVSKALAARLSSAPPCNDAEAARFTGWLRDLDAKLLAGDWAGYRRTGEMLLDAWSKAPSATDDITAHLRGYRDAVAPEVAAERSVLLRVLAPADADLVEMLRSDDADRRNAAMRAATHAGLERLHVLDVVRTSIVESPDAARRAVFAATALSDRSPAVRDLVVGLLADAEPVVRKAAWTSLSGALPADVRTGAAYDPDAAEAERSAALTRLRAALAH